jgi:1-phosphatidylinositol-3-phosphate 5-kinase
VLDSVKDAIKDDSDSSDSSSEADDEGDGDDEPRTVTELIQQTESPESEASRADDVKVEPIDSDSAETKDTDAADSAQNRTENSSLHAPGLSSLPPSPFLSSFRIDQTMTPPHSDIDVGTGATERSSILKAISGFWLQPPPMSRNSFEGDDPMNDPEHIFRDSSMVVRTDEPTSIIALALK